MIDLVGAFKDKSRLLFGVLCILVPLLSFDDSLQASGQTDVLLTTAFGPPISNKEQTGFFDQLMSSVFGRVGLSVTIDNPPAERALINANAGIADGDGPRIAHLEQTGYYPNLIRVPEKVMSVEFVAFALNDEIDISKWQDLAAFDVGIVRGWKILEQNIVDVRSLIKIKTPDLLFGLLEAGRVDLVIIDRWTGEAVARRRGMKRIRQLNPPLATRQMFLYLNKKHAKLVTRITTAIKAAKADGTYARIRRETLGTLAPEERE